MYLLWQTLLFVLLPSVLAEGKLEERGEVQEHCFTSFAKKSISLVPTVSFTSTVTDSITRTKIIHFTKTITPTVISAVVSTDSITTTVSGNATTDTATVVDTSTNTVTQTANATTITNTQTETSTSIVSTVTISAASGFFPIQSTLPDSSYKLKNKREAHAGSLQARANPKPLAGVSIGKYPEKVRCNVFDHVASTTVVTSTESPLTKTAKPFTSSPTTITTLTSTSTIFPPDVSITVTSTSTEVDTITSTPTLTANVTSTTTIISTASAAPTFYAQCANNNMASQGPDGALCGVEVEGSSNVYSTTVDSSYDCCVACLLDSQCGLGLFILGAGTCTIAEWATCTNPSQYQQDMYELAGTASLYEYFNGNCAEISTNLQGSQTYKV